MGADRDIVENQARDLKDYTDTIAAVHLLKEVVANGAVVTVGAAKEIVDIENDKKSPKLGNVVKAILDKAGKPGTGRSQWVQKEDEKWHLEAAITIGGAVYTVDVIFEAETPEEGQEYTLNITSKLSEEVSRGKLFFNPDHAATVKLTLKEGEVHAVTKKGLAVDTTSFIPHAYQNEILAKYSESLAEGNEQRLAVMGTGSGKSIIMAGIAQAVGRTVMIVPDKTLVDQQALETQKMLGAGVVRGSRQTPAVFTLETLKDKVDVENWEELSGEDIQNIQEYFRQVIQDTSDDHFDQIVLQAEHPLFKIIAPEIKDSMVLIDESHRHTFKDEDTALLRGLKENNSILALTATPTSKLYDLFSGPPLDDLSLGAAIQLGTIRPIKPEVAYWEAGDLVDQAVIHYFDDYYLTEGMTGYTDPVELKAQIKKEHAEMGDSEAEKLAIERALELNRIRCQRNMGFSDDKETREQLATVYQKLAEGDRPTLEKYQGKVAELRRESEFQARLQLARKFNRAANEEEVSRQVPLREVDLKQDIDTEQRKDIQRTINSYALALIFNEKAPDLAEKDRTHKLEEHLKGYDEHIVKYKKQNDEIPPPVLSKLQSCEGKDRVKLADALAKMGPPISKLPREQKEAIEKLILDRAEQMVAKIKASEPISDIITNAPAVDLGRLGGTENYASAIDMGTKQSIIDEQLAQIEVGLRTHIVADEVIATGVSIKDILNVQIVNSYSPVVESNINVINGILSGPQAAGRCVRHKDVEARAQQYIDKRYQGKGLILTVDEVIDAKESATKTRAVMKTREEQANKEGKAATVIQSWVKRFQTARLFKEYKPLGKEIERHKQELELLKAQLEDKKKCLESKEKELKQHEVTKLEEKLEIVPGRKEGKRLPIEYTRNPILYSTWVRLELLLENEEVRQGYKELKDEIEELKGAKGELEQLVERATSTLKKIEDKKVQIEEDLGKRASKDARF